MVRKDEVRAIGDDEVVLDGDTAPHETLDLLLEGGVALEAADPAEVVVALVLAVAFLPRRTTVSDPEPEEVATIGL